MPSTQSQVRLTISSLLEVCSYPLVSGKQQQLPPVATPSEEEGQPGEGAAVLSSQTLWQSGEQSHSKHVPNAAYASSAYMQVCAWMESTGLWRHAFHLQCLFQTEEKTHGTLTLLLL